MSFDTWTFAAFFAVVFGVYWLPLPWRAKKLHLLVSSYLFYAAWNPPFVLLLVLSTIVDAWVARRIDALPDGGRRRAFLFASLAVNLGLLGYFKYGGFLLVSLRDGLGQLGLAWAPPVWDVVLPVGISFYTFQTLSYTLDVYLRRSRAWSSTLDFAVYVSFFPQLVAGPIVRSSHFLPQLEKAPRFCGGRLGWGLSLFLVGLFQKKVLADAWFAPQADRLFAASGVLPTALDAWCGTLAFAGQIFCDFAGYSTCAIGLAMTMGFELPDNFRRPYGAIGFSDFWRRWHLSLSFWLRDYLYIPLGGNRDSAARTYRNLMVVMLLGGLWHGAAWTFVAWGGLHGALLVLERVVVRRFGAWRISGHRATRLALWILTLAGVLLTWVPFRARSFAQTQETFRAMFAGDQGVARLTQDGALVAAALGLLLVAVHRLTRERSLESIVAKLPWWLWSFALAAMAFALLLHPGEDRAFIYFQF
ncbi:MAG: MBOAT family protein [Planctomycetota bacterium]